MQISIFNNIVLLKRIYKKRRGSFIPFSSLNISLKEMRRRSEAGRDGGGKEGGERVWAQMVLFSAGSPPNPASL